MFQALINLVPFQDLVHLGLDKDAAAARHAVGIAWMTKNELNDAIPPIHTQFIREQLMIQPLASKRNLAQSRKQA